MVEAEKMAAQAQDPVLQLQKEELALEDKKITSKTQVDLAKINADLTETAEKIASTEKIEGAKLGVKIAETSTKEELESKKIASQDKLEGAKLGVEIAKEIMIDERTKEITDRDDE